MNDFRTIHRFMPATEKCGTRTACGIGLLTRYGDLCEADDGGTVKVSDKGQPLDCKRCRFVLDRHHAKGPVA